MKESRRAVNDEVQAGWIDRLVAAIEGIPGPTWLVYLLILAVNILMNHLVFWIDGSLKPGAFDFGLSIFAFYVLYWMGLYHYLTIVASRALETFRPLLEASEAEIRQLEAQLTLLPRRVSMWLLPLGFIVTLLNVSSDLEYVLGPVANGARTWLPVVYFSLVTAFGSSAFFALFLRTIRQLRFVGELHRQAVGIDLLDLEPAHAFSGLTARTGIGMILLIGISSFQGPIENVSNFELFSFLAIIVLAVAVFVVPLEGMHRLLREERKRELKELNGLLRKASNRLHQQVREGEYDHIQRSKDALAALTLERERLQKTSTWPWNPGTVRGFSSTLLLPIFLLLVTRLIERLF